MHCTSCEYILDLYFTGDITHLWTKTVTGETRYYKLAYHPKIYVTADMSREEARFNIEEQQYLTTPEYPRDLREIAYIVYSHPDVISVKFVQRFLTSHHTQLSNVLEVELYSLDKLEQVVKDFRSRRINMYNIDINPRQQFFIDTQSRSMTAVHIITKKRGVVRAFDESRYYNDYDLPEGCEEIVSIIQHENMDRLDYFLPPLQVVELDVETHKLAAFASNRDRIKQISIKYGIYHDNSLEPVSTTEFTGVELQILHDFEQTIHTLDPDFMLIPKGDKFVLNYLAHRARKYGIQLILGRLDEHPLYARKQQEGQSYMTYGQIMHRDPVIYLPGRVHIDNQNSFFFYDSGFDGVIELSRMSGTPLARVSRASIGTVLTGIEMLINSMTIPATLLPPAKARGERFKTADHLLISDNGGLIYDAVPGIYTGVWAIDFTSLYPFIMMNHNISSETVLCEHEECKQPTMVNQELFDDDPYYYANKKKMAERAYQYDNIVPEVNYHICTKRVGIVTRTMSYILNKRVELKRLKKDSTTPKFRKDRYKRLDSAMKWILVSCFGYLGFRNARWGAIEAHQSVTAYARRYLLQGKLLAEQHGFKLIGGITDSLFLQAKKPEFDNKEHMQNLVRVISEKTGIPMDTEGRFKWVVFCNVKDYSRISALNRYFGYFDHGEFKLRGIRHRQRRVTTIEKEFQEIILEMFKNADTLEVFEQIIPNAELELMRWKKRLMNKEIDPNHLIIKLKTGKGSGNYKAVNTHQAITARIYDEEGNSVEAGENMYYIVRNDKAKGRNRITIGPQVTADSDYDPVWYGKLLENAFLEILETPQHQFYGKVKYDGNPRSATLHDFGFEEERVQKNVDYEKIYERLKTKKARKIAQTVSLDTYF
ncbi:MAG: hypothetical protein INQ03_17930 [Candidatus Heimdallarchaeota archaeon]|nr:hypothetical protein [Candidatus Heimdallarchaeota archaeon]